MYVYEKIVNGVRKLFGTHANIPAENDPELVYRDADGDVLQIVEGDSYVDDGKGGIIRRSDDKPVYVNIGTGTTAHDNIIPGGWTPAAKTVKKIKVATKPDKLEYIKGESLDLAGMVVKLVYEDGDEAVATSYSTDPANGAALTQVGDVTVTVYAEGKSTTFKVRVGI